MGSPVPRGSLSSSGGAQVSYETPEATSRSTVRASAGFTTVIRHTGQRNEYVL